jgi:5-methylcytosine-specific restriction endonuclease McrA
MQSTLKTKAKTHPGMLPQSQALKVSFDAPAKEKAGTSETDLPERSFKASLAVNQTDFQHGRGERPKGPSPSLQRGERSGVIRVFVRGADGKPLMPCHPARARELLRSGRARVHRLCPYTIRLYDRKEGATQPVVLKIDPGAITTGIALNRQELNNRSQQTVLHLVELTHRGTQIGAALTQRAAYRRRRRNANLRYRAPRFLNRTRPKGWLPPSLQSRVDNIVSWQQRWSNLVPITSIEIESVKFDLQKLENPGISGIAYQQGTLLGYELREYLLEKWGRKCAYCDATNVALQVEHIVPQKPKSRFTPKGSDRPSNLTIACEQCNRVKGNNPVELFLADQPERLKQILSHTKRPLSAATAVNAMRVVIVERVQQMSGIQVVEFSGGRTKFNRSRLGIPKSHALDAACVGELEHLENWNSPVLWIKATGRGSYQRTRLTKDGFPRGYLLRKKSVKGFRTGDLVRALVPTGKKAGTYIGRVAVRSSGRFNVQTRTETIQGVSHKYCRRLVASDGYKYDQVTTEVNLDGLLV